MPRVIPWVNGDLGLRTELILTDRGRPESYLHNSWLSPGFESRLVVDSIDDTHIGDEILRTGGK